MTSHRSLTLAALQMRLDSGYDVNIKRVANCIREAAADGAQVILPPELFEGHYFCREEREEAFR
ncbi:MAG TPA: hypothetical protein V6D19_04985, partial [Stenomitos sp.]